MNNVPNVIHSALRKPSPQLHLFSKVKDSTIQTMTDMAPNEGIALNVELVGIKNLKTTHTWRLEFDVYEIDSHKVKDLMDIIEKPLVIGLVEHGR